MTAGKTDEQTAAMGSDAWPDATVVVRGGSRDVVHLGHVGTRDGAWSVVSQPGMTFDHLCRGVRHGTARRTTLGQIREAGGQLTPSPTPDTPPYHCDVTGLTVATFDAILGPEERNPIAPQHRWRGTGR